MQQVQGKKILYRCCDIPYVSAESNWPSNIICETMNESMKTCQCDSDFVIVHSTPAMWLTTPTNREVLS